MAVLFNNCSNRPHSRLFSAGAFFDLYNRAPHEGIARGLEPGTECVVASKVDRTTVRFTRYRFTHERLETPKGEPEAVRVFYGEECTSVTMPKAAAADDPAYAVFFDRLGRFKQLSYLGVQP